MGGREVGAGGVDAGDRQGLRACPVRQGCGRVDGRLVSWEQRGASRADDGPEGNTVQCRGTNDVLGVLRKERRRTCGDSGHGRNQPHRPAGKGRQGHKGTTSPRVSAGDTSGHRMSQASPYAIGESHIVTNSETSTGVPIKKGPLRSQVPRSSSLPLQAWHVSRCERHGRSIPRRRHLSCQRPQHHRRP